MGQAYRLRGKLVHSDDMEFAENVKMGSCFWTT